MLSVEQLKQIYESEKEDILRDYFTFLRFKSIATDPSFKQDVRKCAHWLADYLEKCGLQVEKWEHGEGSPTLFATHFQNAKETLLIYCHYDVQPVDPLNLWETPPFEPTVREGNVFARGAADNKGQCFYTIRAIKTLLEHAKPLNVNLKFLIEGEEESGSTTLSELLKTKQEELKADHILIVDSGMERAGQPAITLGVRGLVCMSLTLKGSKFDLHSGTHGGIVYNPNRALVELLAKLHDENGKVTIAGFYDNVKSMREEEKKEFSFNYDTAYLESHFGAHAIGMEKGFTPYEASWTRPTLEINGISGGYAGAGFKTVIPAEACAKISCRLVPDQDPNQMGELVKNHLIKHVPKGLELSVEILPGKGRAFRSSSQAKIAQAMKKSYSEVFHKPCKQIMIGGSIPIAADLAQVAGGEMIFVGVGLSEDQIHAPNEHFGLDRFEQGYLAIARGIQLLNLANF